MSSRAGTDTVPLTDLSQRHERLSIMTDSRLIAFFVVTAHLDASDPHAHTIAAATDGMLRANAKSLARLIALKECE